MKAVMMSIQPKWCELIASGKKTVEVRKTIPKLEPPFKCYVYETRGKPVRYSDIAWEFEGRGKVIGEFVCDYIIRRCEMANADIAEQRGFIKREKLFEYANGKELYGLHISDLVIYDVPKELSKFNKPFPFSDFCLGCEINQRSHKGYNKEYCGSCDQFKPKIKRPPQSWCYVEELV